MKDCAWNGATLNLAARKLNQTGYVQRHCGLVNTEVKVRKLKNALQISQSMATITNGQCSDRAQQRVEKQLEYRTLAPVALEKLKGKNGELNKITKNEILSIMYFYFLILGNDKKNKPLVLAAFMHCYLKAPEKIPFCVWCTDASPAPIATITWEMDDDDTPFDVGVQLIIKYFQVLLKQNTVPCAFKTRFKNRSEVKIKNSHNFDRSVRYFAPFDIRAYTLL
jgi:hypothetical protein